MAPGPVPKDDWPPGDCWNPPGPPPADGDDPNDPPFMAGPAVKVPPLFIGPLPKDDEPPIFAGPAVNAPPLLLDDEKELGPWLLEYPPPIPCPCPMGPPDCGGLPYKDPSFMFGPAKAPRFPDGEGPIGPGALLALISPSLLSLYILPCALKSSLLSNRLDVGSRPLLPGRVLGSSKSPYSSKSSYRMDGWAPYLSRPSLSRLSRRLPGPSKSSYSS